MFNNSNWIRPPKDTGDVCPVFQKRWYSHDKIKQGTLYITALGVYEAKINGHRLSDYVLAPGWTDYRKRLQYQQYDITELIQEQSMNKQPNLLQVTVGKGWFRSPMPGWLDSEDRRRRTSQPCGIIGEIHITYANGIVQIIPTDHTWECQESAVRFSEIYDGEVYDATYTNGIWETAVEFPWSKDILIPQEGEEIHEMERIMPKAKIKTKLGDTLIDFGQEITGYVEITLHANEGEEVILIHGEVLDQHGEFYRENYRSAKAKLHYICKDGNQTWHPTLTFYGFRYIKIEKFPCEPELNNFMGIVVYSNMKKTGNIQCSNPQLNQLFSNVFWGQKGNFLDVPTDCPQRDERLGWTGDAQVFVKAASYNYDVERFFCKWLRDLSSCQRADGGVGQVVPDYLPKEKPSAAWGDAATVCPWQIYLTYGNKQVLEEQFDSMKRWVDYISNTTTTKYLWTGGQHFGDWLGLDAPAGSYKGSSREDLIATAFYAYSTEILVKAGRVIGKQMTEYEILYQNIVKAFQETYPEYKTQTEHVLVIQFNLAKNMQETADALADLVKKDGYKLQTGFVGTPYILHTLSKYGHADLAYTLLLRTEYPSWLYPITKGATTIWEHWDGIMENGAFWSKNMNSFNHYAYGSVIDWVYEVAAGIQVIEDAPGFEKVYIQPIPDSRIDWLEASIQTRYGKVLSKWNHQSDGIRYEIITEMPAIIRIGLQQYDMEPGHYTFWC